MLFKNFVCRPETGPKHFNKFKPEPRSTPKARLTGSLGRFCRFAHSGISFIYCFKLIARFWVLKSGREETCIT